MSVGEVLGVVAAILTPVLGVLTLLINRLRERDKLQFDLKLKTFEDAVTRCEGDCRSAREAAVTDRQRREEAELKAAKMEGQITSLARENQELRNENRELRDHLMKVRDARFD